MFVKLWRNRQTLTHVSTFGNLLSNIDKLCHNLTMLTDCSCILPTCMHMYTNGLQIHMSLIVGVDIPNLMIKRLRSRPLVYNCVCKSALAMYMCIYIIYIHTYIHTYMFLYSMFPVFCCFCTWAFSVYVLVFCECVMCSVRLHLLYALYFSLGCL